MNTMNHTTITTTTHRRRRIVTLSPTTLMILSLIATSLPALAQSDPDEPRTIRVGTPAVVIEQTNDSQKQQEPIRFTAAFSPKELEVLLSTQSDLLPATLQVSEQRIDMVAALQRVNMGIVLERLTPFLKDRYSNSFDASRDTLTIPVEQEYQVTVETPDLPGGSYTGPREQTIGFLVHDLTEADYINIAIRVMQTARQLLLEGRPESDRMTPDYYTMLAEREIDKLRAAADSAQKQELRRVAVRQKMAEALGVFDPETGTYTGKPKWVKESRRFSYIVKDGQFIDRLKPLVDKINNDIQMAGFASPIPNEKPGIYFDKDIQDVELLLPETILEEFLDIADQLERRMAEDHMISIEAVRLTDREITDGALASRLNVSSVNVNNIDRRDLTWVREQVGINALLAVANNALQVGTLRGVESGQLPNGTTSPNISGVNLPFSGPNRAPTTLGGNFSVGDDDLFFNGREQNYGISYIGPDGMQHQISFDVVDSLREFWDRIERNLIVHKIKKTDTPNSYTVPVGPESKTFKGIAALISQENRNQVISNEGTLVELSATAGTWLIVQNFEIEPTPGSSTALSADEITNIEDRVLLTMFLRDASVDVDFKTRLVEAASARQLHRMLDDYFEQCRDEPIRPGARSETYESIYDARRDVTVRDAAVEKKEQNSTIKLAFYSSQGNIIQQADINSLGDANDLTSFTTEVRPNVVTPISSFFTKTASGAKGTSPLTGVAKGEESYGEKTMAHLVVRVRFPTVERENSDLYEGRYQGYFDLPFGRNPHNSVDLPFLSSSEHPLNRLAELRTGMMFEVLQLDAVRKPFDLWNPNRLTGHISPDAYETGTTRLLLTWKIISDSPAPTSTLESQYRARFKTEVRPLLEYDKDFFDAPAVALRNMSQWNNPDRVVLALNNSPKRFALKRLILMIDELGQKIIPDEYADQFLAVSESDFLSGHSLRPLTDRELRNLRRDVANHYLRYQEFYGDAFLEAVSIILQLGTYATTSDDTLQSGPFRGYRDMVVCDNSARALANRELFELAHEKFLILKFGGFNGRVFESSLATIEDLDSDSKPYVIRGRDILDYNHYEPPPFHFVGLR